MKPLFENRNQSIILKTLEKFIEYLETCSTSVYLFYCMLVYLFYFIPVYLFPTLGKVFPTVGKDFSWFLGTFSKFWKSLEKIKRWMHKARLSSHKRIFSLLGNLLHMRHPELLACENSKYYKILEWWKYLPSTNYKPWKEFIENLYNKRLELKNTGNPTQLPIKIITNAIYGNTGQTKNVIGNFFNPVIFSSITGDTRAELYKFVIDNQLEKDVICFATDSVCTTKSKFK